MDNREASGLDPEAEHAEPREGTAPPTELYFAYGTLLDLAEMHRYCPSARALWVAGLANHRLDFWAYGTTEKKVGCHLSRDLGRTAYGVVYSVPLDEMDNLDRVSGVDKGEFDRRPVTVVTAYVGSPRVVTTYFQTAPEVRAAPDRGYAELVRRGLLNVDLPKSYVESTLDFLDSLSRGQVEGK